MKKILLALALLVAALVPVATIATPAQAYSCVSHYKTVKVDVISNTFPVGHWEDTARLNYRVCNEPNTVVCDDSHCYYLFDTTAYADSYTISHRFNDSSFGTCGDISSFQWNPNAIGNVDLAAKTKACSKTDTSMTWDFANQKITQGMSDAKKCLGTTLTKIRVSTNQTQSIPTLCVTFAY